MSSRNDRRLNARHHFHGKRLYRRNFARFYARKCPRVVSADVHLPGFHDGLRRLGHLWSSDSKSTRPLSRGCYHESGNKLARKLCKRTNTQILLKYLAVFIPCNPDFPRFNPVYEVGILLTRVWTHEVETQFEYRCGQECSVSVASQPQRSG